ncbi:hypothetical protein RQP46_011374 [Phenoliferia psychrophenolica]
MAPVDSLALPHELLVNILAASVTPIFDHLGPAARCSRLAELALVSRQFLGCAYDILYRDLRVEWKAGTAALLLRTLGENPALCRTASLTLEGITESNWCHRWVERTEKRMSHEGALAPWDLPDADGLEPPTPDVVIPDGLHGDANDEEEVYEDTYQYRFECAMLEAAGREWERNGHAQWSHAHPQECEVLDVISLLPNLSRLSFKSCATLNHLGDDFNNALFTEARTIVGRLDGLSLSLTNGIFVEWLLTLLTHPFDLSVSNMAPWGVPEELSRNTAINVATNPTRLSFDMKPRPWHMNLVNPESLRHVSFVLRPIVGPTVPPPPSVDLQSWLPLLANAPLLESLHIHLEPVIHHGHQLFDATRLLKMPYSHSPSPSHQAALGIFLATSTLQSLTIQWWPTRALATSLPPTLELLSLGPQCPHGDAAPTPGHVEAALERAELAGVLQKQRLPAMRTILIPFVPKERVATSPIVYSRPVNDEAEFQLRREELEALQLRVRVVTFIMM